MRSKAIFNSFNPFIPFTKNNSLHQKLSYALKLNKKSLFNFKKYVKSKIYINKIHYITRFFFLQ